MWGHFWTWAAHYLVKQYIQRYEKPDIIHAQSTLWAGCAARQLASLGIPYVITEQTSAIHDRQFSDCDMANAARALRGASRVIACSSSLATLLRDRGLAMPEQLRVVPYTVNVSEFDLPPQPPPQKPFRFLVVGYLESCKRVSLAIKAFAHAFPDDAD